MASVWWRYLSRKHGALLDAGLLAAVYVELTTTRQAALQLEPITSAPLKIHAIVRSRPWLLPPRVIAAYFFSHHAPRAVPSSPRSSITVQHHHDVAFHNRYVGIRSTGGANQPAPDNTPQVPQLLRYGRSNLRPWAPPIAMLGIPDHWSARKDIEFSSLRKKEHRRRTTVRSGPAVGRRQPGISVQYCSAPGKSG
jgi:hypothetical protein